MAKPASKSKAAAPDYWEQSQWPLQALVFLSPLIVFYELGMALLSSNRVRAALGMKPFGGLNAFLKARHDLTTFFEHLGITGIYLPGLVIAVVLMTCHLVRRDPWRLEPRLYWRMGVESLALTTCLFVLLMVLSRKVLPAAAGTTPLGVLDYLVLSVGAGVYEELIFRLVGIALLHFVLVDWLRIPRGWGAGITVGVTSLAFAYYHFNDANPFHFGLMLFYTAAGVYFAGIYVLRGFGIVVAVHALYDILVVLYRWRHGIL